MNSWVERFGSIILSLYVHYSMNLAHYFRVLSSIKTLIPMTTIDYRYMLVICQEVEAQNLTSILLNPLDLENSNCLTMGQKTTIFLCITNMSLLLYSLIVFPTWKSQSLCLSESKTNWQQLKMPGGPATKSWMKVMGQMLWYIMKRFKEAMEHSSSGKI